MASFEVEQQFVALYWRNALRDDPMAQRLGETLRPDVFEHEGLGKLFGALSTRYAAGTLQDDDATETAVEREVGDVPLVANIAALRYGYNTEPKIRPYAAEILYSWRARRIGAFLTDMASVIVEMAPRDPKAALKKADDSVAKTLAMCHELNGSGEPMTRKEFSDAERRKLEAKGESVGKKWPYPRLQRALSYIRPGMVVGITAMPSAGKSTFLANLFAGLVQQRVPCLVAPTEMRDQWLSRAYAAVARVPQEVAENALWDAKDPEIVKHLADVWSLTGPDAEAEVEYRLRAYRERYLETIDRFEDLPWEVIASGDLTPGTIIARFRILRRLYPGRLVVGMIDHMHNLEYPNRETDKHVGEAVKELKQLAQDDTDGGMAVICLFQPRKPEKHQGEAAMYRPVPAQEIRGQVAQVLDVHMGIYRQTVKVDPNGKKTPWGTPAALRDEDGRVKFCKPTDEDAKDDDEHIYLKPDKRRVAGTASGKTIVLDFNAETGTVYEEDRRRHIEPYGGR